MNAPRSGDEDKRIDDEITDAMIDAGYRVLIYGYDPDDSESQRRLVVKEMYKAMTLAKQEGTSRLIPRE